jgi:16S rRNA (guanine966-N2)-methyltransferase
VLIITGGTLRGRRIPSPKGKQIRPTTSMVRESLFQRIAPDLRGVRFLDAFAGSGMMSLEALSRGAASVYAIEKHRATVNTLVTQLERLNIPSEQWQCVCADTEAHVQKSCPVAPFHIVFLDPPYGMVPLGPLIQNLQCHGWLERGALLIVEQGKLEADLPDFEYRAYGETKIGMCRLDSIWLNSKNVLIATCFYRFYLS